MFDHVTGTEAALIIAALLVCALCAGLEVAVGGSNKLFVELERQRGALWTRLLGGSLQRPAQLMGVLLVGNTLALVLFGTLLARSALQGLSLGPVAWSLLLVVLGCSGLFLVVGEFLPRALARTGPNKTLRALALPLRLLHLLLWFPTLVVTAIGELVLRIAGVRRKQAGVHFGRVDLEDFVKEPEESPVAEEPIEPEVEYFRNTLELSNTQAKELMVPRAEIQAVHVDSTVALLRSRFVDTGLSKLLVHKGDLDDIIGYVHGYELFKHPTTIRSVLRPIGFIPGSMPADQVLQHFTKQRTHVAVVLGEQGATAGMITIEDVVETIVGEIDDEHDAEEAVEERPAPDTFVLSGHVTVEHLVKAHDLAIPESEEYDTLAGFILHRAGRTPGQGAVLELPPFRITIVHLVHGRIDLVRLQVVDPERGFMARDEG